MESHFKAEISPFLLRFKNPEIEEAYTNYKLYERTVPKWFKWYMLLFIGFLVFRKAELLIFAIAGVKSVTPDPRTELVSFIAIIISYLLEVFPVYFKKLAFLRGLSILLSSFYGVTRVASICSDRPALSP